MSLSLYIYLDDEEKIAMCVGERERRSSEVEVPPEGVCLNLPTLPTLPIDLELPRPAVLKTRVCRLQHCHGGLRMMMMVT